LKRRIRRDLRRLGLGILQITSPATDQRKIAKHHAVVDSLIEDSQIAVLQALMEHRVTLDQLVEAQRQNELSGASVLISIAKREPLWEAMKKAIPQMGKGSETRKRYDQTRRSLEKKAASILTSRATVGDLAGVDWNRLRLEWGNSASDWMHLRRFVSAFLTKHLGDVYHPFRRQVMKGIPTAKEAERVPDLTPEMFWHIVAKAREHVRPAYVTLVLTGMRDRSEYLKCTKANLKPAIRAVQVPGTKTEGSVDTVYIEESMWPWIEAGIPSPLAYKRLRELWIEACDAAGVKGIRLHDLRHCHGQWATNEGVAESKVQSSLRHTSISTTRRYTKQKARGEVANAMSRALGSRTAPEQTQDDVNLTSIRIVKDA
jgi:integrase